MNFHNQMFAILLELWVPFLIGRLFVYSIGLCIFGRGCLHKRRH